MNVAVVCFDFKPSNLRKQPWRYVHELIRKLPEERFEITVISSVDRSETAGFRIRSVDRILGLRGPTAEVIHAIEQENPDVVVTLVGPTTFIRPSNVASTISRPTIGLFAGPLYSIREVLNVGVKELYKNYQYLTVHLAGSLVPDRLIRARSSEFRAIVTLTREDQSRLRRASVNTRLTTIPPGIDSFDLELPTEGKIADVRDELNPNRVPLILYFTSPLTLRGTDTLIEAFAQVRRKHSCKLVVLARQDNGGLTREEARLRRLATERSVSESFEIVPRNLSPEGVKTYLAAADVIALPFKIVLSSVPISLLEAMSIGNPIVSTKIAGIPELVENEQQLVEPGDLSSLTIALERFVADADLRNTIGSRNRQRMQEYQRWDESRAQFLALLEDFA